MAEQELNPRKHRHSVSERVAVWRDNIRAHLPVPDMDAYPRNVTEALQQFFGTGAPSEAFVLSPHETGLAQDVPGTCRRCKGTLTGETV